MVGLHQNSNARKVTHLSTIPTLGDLNLELPWDPGSNLGFKPPKGLIENSSPNWKGEVEETLSNHCSIEFRHIRQVWPTYTITWSLQVRFLYCTHALFLYGGGFGDFIWNVIQFSRYVLFQSHVFMLCYLFVHWCNSVMFVWGLLKLCWICWVSVLILFLWCNLQAPIYIYIYNVDEAHREEGKNPPYGIANKE